MMDVFKSMESDLNATWKQNEILKNQLLEATLEHDVEKCVLMCLDSMNDDLTTEIEKVKRESIDVHENLHKRIKILKYEVGDHPWSKGQSLHASRPSRLCARARSVDDMPFRTRACMGYTRWVFCKRYGRPKVHHLVYPTKRHGSLLRSFQVFISSHDWIPQLAHLFVGDTRWRDGE
ncbi:hypothetical protein Tco_0495924 [Tanacetum coccineum]